MTWSSRIKGLWAWISEHAWWLAPSMIAIALVASWFAYDRWLARSIVVEADTGALRITLTAQLDGKSFPDAIVCMAKPAPKGEAVSNRLGCPQRFGLARVRFYSQVFPEGTVLSLTTRPGAVQIRVESVPAAYEGTDLGRMVGGGITLTGRALESFGSLHMIGEVLIGAPHADSERISTVSGNYQVGGFTPTSLIDGDMRILRRGDLLAGALVRFTNRGEHVEARVYATMPEIETSLLRVTAISRARPDDLTIRYFFTDDIHIRPTLPEALIVDPLVQLLIAVLGATAGYGWFRKLLGRK